MRCPVCKQRNQNIDQFMRGEGFSENIIECDVCGTTWSVNHGVAEVVAEPLACSFMQASTEMVEADDYNYAGV